MRIGVYPFASTGNINDNLHIIENAVQEAAGRGVRLLAFHECALCGYPPVESDLASIHPAAVESALRRIGKLARLHCMWIAVGTVRFDDDQRFNSIVLFDDRGQIAGFYDKSSLWGWDCDHFSPGSLPGLFEIDGFRVGFRICFDIRFPELFRSLYLAQADLCIVAFSDTSDMPDSERYDIIKAHLITRASENTMTVISVNSLSLHSTAPTAVFDPNGCMLAENPRDRECLMIHDFSLPEVTFSMRGRRFNADRLL